MSNPAEKYFVGEIKPALLKRAKRLLDNERQNPTSPYKVQKRFRGLTMIVSGMLQTGSSVKEILPKNEGLAIETLIRQGQLNEAAKRVHAAILIV